MTTDKVAWSECSGCYLGVPGMPQAETVRQIQTLERGLSASVVAARQARCRQRARPAADPVALAKLTERIISGFERDDRLTRPISPPGPKPRLVEVIGYATLWAYVYRHHGQLESMMPGCFTDYLAAGHDVPAVLSHNKGRQVASTAAGLKLVEDMVGLRVEASVDADSIHGDYLLAAIRRGEIIGMSFERPAVESALHQRFPNGESVRRWFDRGEQVQEFHRASLGEVTFCDQPGNPATCCIIADDHRVLSFADPHLTPALIDRWMPAADARAIALRRLKEHCIEYRGQIPDFMRRGR